MASNKNNFEKEFNKIKRENDNLKNNLNQILTEYADYRVECEEIYKEYEDTIQLLTDSLEKFKTENSRLNNDNSRLISEKEKMKIEQEKVAKELEKAREKNKDKIKDIEILNNKLDELQSQFNAINNKEITLKSKVVHLEKDNDHYWDRIHQYEEEVSDLKYNLENATENLILAQDDFEEYKKQKEEELERLKLQLQEEQNNVKALMSKKLKPHKLEISDPNPIEGSDDGIFVFKGSSTKEEIEEIQPLENEKKPQMRLRGRKPGRKDKQDDKKKVKGNNEFNHMEELSKLKKRREKIAKFMNQIKKK